MADTPLLLLPEIDPNQSQKHVTHNEALRLIDALVHLAVLDRDLATPPASPTEGACYLVAASPTGAWSAQAGKVALWRAGAWAFLTPRAGWRAYIVDEARAIEWNGTAWVSTDAAIRAPQALTLLGIGTTADATNPFTAKLNKALWTAKTTSEGGDGDLRYTLNKETGTDVLSFLMQTNWSGRAEFGLIGTDDVSLKVSPDGSAWTTAFSVARVSGAMSLAADLTAQGVRVGRGNSGVATNTAFGTDALAAALAAGDQNTAVGFEAGKALTSGRNNTALGWRALSMTATGAANVAIGAGALTGLETGVNNVAAGVLAGAAMTSGGANTLLGRSAGEAITTGSENTCVGSLAGDALTTAGQCVLVGASAGLVTTGGENTFLGAFAGVTVTSGANNTLLGRGAGSSMTTQTNCAILGRNAQVTGSNQVQLGDSATTTYVYGTVQNRSDRRDKADIVPTQFGLPFLMALRPVDFRWDFRDDYRTGDADDPFMAPADGDPRDGSKKRTRWHTGLIAQEVAEALAALGQNHGVVQDHTHNGGGPVMTLGYDEFVPMLIRAVQDLAGRVAALEARG